MNQSLNDTFHDFQCLNSRYKQKFSSVFPNRKKSWLKVFSQTEEIKNNKIQITTRRIDERRKQKSKVPVKDRGIIYQYVKF